MISERDLWKKINEPKNSDLAMYYLRERVDLERYSPALFIPITLAGILGLLLLFLISFYPPLAYIIFVLSILLIGEITIYYYKRHELIRKYYEECEKNG